jgi:hypothetical protein
MKKYSTYLTIKEIQIKIALDITHLPRRLGGKESLYTMVEM